MSKRTLWRLVVTLLICGACAYFFIPLSKVRLGLDLRGGVHFELEVQQHEALESDLKDAAGSIADRLRQKGFKEAVAVVAGDKVAISGLPADQKAAVEKALESFGNYRFDVQGATATAVQKDTYKTYLKDDASKRALQIIENRINQFGVAEPEITPSGPEGNRIVVELPGVGEAERERIKGLLSTPGRLELRLLAKAPVIYFSSKEQALDYYKGQLPPDTELIPEPEEEKHAPGAPKAPRAPKPHAAPKEEKFRRWVLLESKVQFDGRSITDAHRGVDPNTGFNEVNFSLDRAGTEANAAVTEIAANENRQFAFVLDRKIVSVLSAKEKINSPAVRISSPGGFDEAYADDFALKLKSGAMRASMKFLEESAVGASLGADSIRKGVIASLIGFLTIIVFMVVWYRWSGVNAIVALTVNVIVMLGLLGSFHATITLPGIAGFALTIGMAVDANILIFERIREELANGRSVPMAIQAGFDRVFWTIVDAHVTQLFAALLLFIFGTGPVKGFAVSLTVGVVASLFTSIYISRFIYDWILERHPGTKTLSV
ncbi:MAG: protein translocase subunit SecD [Holophagaceae bacterium]